MIEAGDSLQPSQSCCVSAQVGVEECAARQGQAVALFEDLPIDVQEDVDCNRHNLTLVAHRPMQRHIPCLNRN
jgi:hypothetical protein